MHGLSSSRPIAIVAPPPTPNGDLHVGHLSGPYLGADVLRRYEELRGRKTIAALSVDLNQSYVVTTAERLGREPRELAVASHGEVSETLAAASIGFDVVGIPDAAYTAYVTDWFRRMHTAGIFERRTLPVAFDVRRGRALFEAYASGHCPVCLASTKANICEACGHPNDAKELIGLYPTGGAKDDPIETRSQSAWVLDLEAWRDDLARHIGRLSAPLRPALRRFLDELFASRLPVFPITFPSSWGIAAPFPDSDGEVLNVWAEMVPGHYWWLQRAAEARGTANPFMRSEPVEYVQFLGFDNSFFYVIAHLALALAARKAGADALLPDAFITNEFLLLDNYKFSTSQGHLIWGRDLLAKAETDEVRFYLAWANPETQQANFSLADFEAVVAKELRQRLDRLRPLLGATRDDDAFLPVAAKLTRRFEAVHGTGRQSLRLIALTLATGLELAIDLAGRNPEAARPVVRALAAGAAPLVPDTAERLWTWAGGTLPVRWSETAPATAVAADPVE